MGTNTIMPDATMANIAWPSSLAPEEMSIKHNNPQRSTMQMIWLLDSFLRAIY